MMTVETAPLLSEADAKRLTERIRYTALGVRDGVEKLQRLVADAQAGQAHVALGYKSWTAYLADVMGDEPLVLDRDQRREVSAWLAGEGMSTRDIAAVVGAGNATVHRDIVASVSDGTVERPHLVVSHDGRERPSSRPTRTDPLGCQQPATKSEPTPPFDPVTGEVLNDKTLVGETYTRPEPKPRRSALIDAVRPQAERVWSTAVELRGAVGDDRFAANRTSISEVVLPRVRAAALDLTAFLAELDLTSAAETEEARDRLAADLNHISETFARLARSLKEEPK